MTRVFLMHTWRARWRTLVVLALMIGLTGAAILAALAGARRSTTALERFDDAAQTLDVFVAADVTTPDPPELAGLLDGPLVESTNDLVFLMVDVEESVVFAPTSRRGLQVEQGVLLEGRRADPDEPDEVTLSESAAKSLDLGVGDTFEAGSISPEQTEALFSAGEEPTSLDGPPLRLHVVGISRTGFDLNGLGEGTALTLTTPAFWDKYGEEIGVGSRSHMVRLVDDPDAVARFTDAVGLAYGDEHLPSINVGQGEDVVADSIRVITAALAAVALVLAVAGTVWIGSALARQQRLVAPDVEVLRALGTTTGERRVLFVGSILPALAAGIVLAAVLAVALSPLFPVGAARWVDPDPGLHLDALAILAGSAALAVVLGLVAAVSAVRLVSQERHVDPGASRVPRFVERTARVLRPAPATGVRFALHAPARASAPVRPALVGALVGAAGLVAVAVVGASLQRLVDTPARWGTTWDVAVLAGALTPGDAIPQNTAEGEPDRGALLADPDIEAAAVLLYDEQVTINGVEAISMTFDPVKGGIRPTTVEGREPVADDEIAVGRDTFDAVGADLGSNVTVSSRSQASGEFRIVGIIAFPTIQEPTTVATGVALTVEGGERLLLGDPSRSDDVGTRYVVLRWAPGVDHDAALAGLGVDGAYAEPMAPPEVRGLGDVERFPLLAGAALFVLGVIATSHALSVTVRRRRRELGILSSLGLTPGQRRSAILAQATTIAAVALVVGVPLGAVLGRLVWSAIAGSMGVATDVAFPIGVLAAGAVGFVVVMNLIAVFPARSARRLRVAEALRSE